LHFVLQAGADAIAVMCPTLFKPSSITQLVKYLKAVADQAPDTPFLYYDINVLTGVICEYLARCQLLHVEFLFLLIFAACT